MLDGKRIREASHVVVAPEDCAARWGNAGLAALSTPALLGHMERACVEALEPHLEAGAMTVGASVNLEHLAPTPVGSTIAIRIDLCRHAGRRLTFRFEVYDNAEKVGEGIHERYVVDRDRFERRLETKAAALAR